MTETKIRTSKINQISQGSSEIDSKNNSASEAVLKVRSSNQKSLIKKGIDENQSSVVNADAPSFLSDKAVQDRDALKDLAKQEFLFEKEIENIEQTGNPLKDLEKKNYQSLKKRKTRENDFPKRSWIRSAAIFSVAAVTLIVVFFGVGYMRLAQLKKAENIVYSELSDKQRQVIELPESEGFVMGEEVVQEDFPVASASEHFKAQEVDIGGGLATLNIGENAPVQIFDIRSEPFTAKQGDEVKILISWRTNKLATSDIEYSINSGQSPRKLIEENYSFSHSVLLSKLQPKTSYVYVITSKDRWGNKISSDRYGVYTASKPESVIDLIIRALEDTFGWAVNR